MRHLIRPAIGILLSAGLAACGGHGASGVAQNPGGLGQFSAVKHVPYQGAVIAPNVAQVCGERRPGFASCRSLVRLDTPDVVPNFNPPGYHPADLKSAYKLNTTKGAGQTIAIVDAFDDPNAEADLKVYRSNFALPPCTTANGCFKKVNQTGGTSYPPPDANWAAEISLDVDMASASCPKCHILLVEGNDNGFLNLAVSVDEAATLGANEISNSYGASEGSYGVNGHYNHPHHVITVSSGDGGFSAGPQFPANLKTVTAVGGTSLFKGGGTRGWHESVWSGAGSGCSTLIAKPSWQHDTACKKRMIADVAAVADPSTGVSVYDTYGGAGGWNVFGGTSVSSPFIAGVYALAGNSATAVYGSFSYSHTAKLFDVTTGSNGPCSGFPAYFCTGIVSYDGPTGNGTPNGSGGF